MNTSTSTNLPRSLAAVILAMTLGAGSALAEGMSSGSKPANAAGHAHPDSMHKGGVMPKGGAMDKAGGMPMAHDGGSSELSKGMTNAMQSMQGVKMSGDVDKDFAMMMKMHHQHALEMAKVEIDDGKSPQLKALAHKIVKDQTREINQLDAWMKKHP